ncbi:type II toxin-antitoxin system RelE/ParE family toxin [Alkalimonas mucilaginosa]|uniref:Type II toxin-antitoxin system RelE/ParE family toxin n=1 Tax=Alkalimonas mucilaginosa TaxID=3057676 RepID=A0ABU7JC96_9GAMM|nr:type II toxin-antitoxin system RelE/ParE family toxin [Alkalimonas sp. MEB004]MEE2023105.1 type II toxin-antitoxin system RelE/ParE family toxin [Alkalimonas sp. MEB004]
MTQLVVTRLAHQTLLMLTRYMTEFLGAEQALSLAEQLLGYCKERLDLGQMGPGPLQFPLCYELERLGVTDYRQITVDKYKILYRYDADKDTAFVMAFLRQKQSAQQLLIAYSLLP